MKMSINEWITIWVSRCVDIYVFVIIIEWIAIWVSRCVDIYVIVIIIEEII